MKCRKVLQDRFLDKKTLKAPTCSEEEIPHTGFCEQHYLENCQGKVGAVQVVVLSELLAETKALHATIREVAECDKL
ncbi:MAG: hypothetical protein KAV87_06920 [Desulfobacteraceae bacterium]|nr:hypothetical protein [Desulfobacteraceae bacterium]